MNARNTVFGRSFVVPEYQRTPRCLAQLIIEVIEAQDGRYDPSAYGARADIEHPCETVCDVAGWAFLFGTPGARLRLDPVWGTYDQFYIAGGEDPVTGLHERATRLLSLNPDEGDWLFNEFRQREQVLAALHSITYGVGGYRRPIH